MLPKNRKLSSIPANVTHGDGRQERIPDEVQPGLRGAPRRLGLGRAGLRAEGGAGDEGLSTLCEARSHLLREVVRAHHDDQHHYLHQQVQHGTQSEESELALHLPQLDAELEHPLAVAMEVVHSLFVGSEDDGQKLSLASQLPQMKAMISARIPVKHLQIGTVTRHQTTLHTMWAPQVKVNLSHKKAHRYPPLTCSNNMKQYKKTTQCMSLQRLALVPAPPCQTQVRRL